MSEIKTYTQNVFGVTLELTDGGSRLIMCSGDASVVGCTSKFITIKDHSWTIVYDATGREVSRK